MCRWKRLAALLLALGMMLGLTACALEQPPSLLEAMEVAADTVDEAAAAEAAEEELLLIEGPEAPADPDTPQETEAPEEGDVPGEPEETPVPPDLSQPGEDNADAEPALDPDGEYTSKEDVALYLHLYGELPKNFMTKNEARALGWSGGGLDGYADGMCIGGDHFGNYEGLLPPGDYRECDIDTLHAKSRGAKRIIYSDDGRIYYTDDHYESFTLLYGEE